MDLQSLSRHSLRKSRNFLGTSMDAEQSFNIYLFQMIHPDFITQVLMLQYTLMAVLNQSRNAAGSYHSNNADD